ncbi:MAG: tRNA (adenosine(37)-N6)-threonylcarbamoyltransferase complex dimerization subunit type 1 TsaB [Muribaculaceae bacterium]|nr:tRNA (adenosine(37)-N6)-threonylcarbamoyltransferase complex dimerization subunit type 1 TsaB [Muribaculaceae bacterium]
MAIIINIETSSESCSVAVSKDGMIDFQLEDTEGMNHAVKLAPFVEKCMAELKRKGERPDAVAVSIGPGSYTGLRIGLSLAKGLAYSLDIPLICIPTLQILAVKAMFRNILWEGDEIIVPMIDARRMEVYMAAFDFSMKEVIKEKPEILSTDSCSALHGKRKVIFIGDGSEKFMEIYQGDNAEWLGKLLPKATDMIALSEKYFKSGKFSDLAYSTPNYLKEYQATVSKNKVLTNNKV